VMVVDSFVGRFVWQVTIKWTLL